MKLNLKTFEQETDPKILKRGLDYYKEGKIEPLTEPTHDGETEFTAYGTEQYDVTVTLDGDEVTDYSCTCPYDMGPVCKHVVAAMFCLADGESMKLDDKGIAKPKTTTKKRFTKKDVEKLLSTLSNDDLKNFIRSICSSNRYVRQEFVSSHINLVMPVSTETYTLQIDELLESCSDRHGFIEWNRAGDVGQGLEDIIEAAKNAANDHDWQEAFCRLKAILAKADLLLNSCDDSNGDIGGPIKEALSFLQELSERTLPEAFRKELFVYCLDCFKRNVLDGWYWNWTFAECAVALTKSKKDCEPLEHLLDNYKSSSVYSESTDHRHVLDIRLLMIDKWGTKEEATEFMNVNMDNPDFRRKLINKSMDAKDFHEVIRIANDGIKKDEEKYPGLANDWRNYQLLSYIEMGDSMNIAILARYFLLGSGDRYNKREYYYDLLKEHTPEDQWQETIQGCISELKRKCMPNQDFIMQIYEWEQEWQQYFDTLRKCVTLRRMEDAEPALAKRYGDDFISLYADALRNYVKGNMGRSSYQEACRYLRRIKKLGAKEVVEELIAEFRVKYKARRALLEELSRV